MSLLEENETIIDGLSEMGEELGNFLTNLAPGLFKFLIFMTIAAGIGLVMYGIFSVINRKIKLR
jgi:K+-transporting ATPase A subunit